MKVHVHVHILYVSVIHMCLHMQATLRQLYMYIHVHVSTGLYTGKQNLYKEAYLMSRHMHDLYLAPERNCTCIYVHVCIIIQPMVYTN